MAGLTVGTAPGARRSLDSDINMIPMIDLLMVTIAFLLVTAVWSQLGRLQGSAQVPGIVDDPTPQQPASRLHVDMRSPDHFGLSWRQGATVLRSVDVAHEMPALRVAITKEWHSSGVHTSPGDAARDEAVLHVADGTSYAEMVAVMDAVEATKRPLLRGVAPAFALTLATQ
jgi:biopolymer transport protein ExbD